MFLHAGCSGLHRRHAPSTSKITPCSCLASHAVQAAMSDSSGSLSDGCSMHTGHSGGEVATEGIAHWRSPAEGAAKPERGTVPPFPKPPQSTYRLIGRSVQHTVIQTRFLMTCCKLCVLLLTGHLWHLWRILAFPNPPGICPLKDCGTPRRCLTHKILDLGPCQQSFVQFPHPITSAGQIKHESSHPRPPSVKATSFIRLKPSPCLGQKCLPRPNQAHHTCRITSGWGT